MITSRRDYILRIIDEVGRLLSRAIFKRKSGEDKEALETVVAGFQRLFTLEADQIFRLTPEQHYEMLVTTPDATPDDIREKVLLYAALSAEAGAIYAKAGNRALARVTRMNALRFTLRVLKRFPVSAGVSAGAGPNEATDSEGGGKTDVSAALPSYTPDVATLRAALAGETLDADLEELLRVL